MPFTLSSGTNGITLEDNKHSLTPLRYLGPNSQSRLVLAAVVQRCSSQVTFVIVFCCSCQTQPGYTQTTSHCCVDNRKIKGSE